MTIAKRLELGVIDKISHLFHEGGLLVMTSITFVLALSLIIVLERIVRYWLVFDLRNSEGFMVAIQKLIMNNSVENALRLCHQARPKLLPLVLTEGLKRSNDTTEEIEHAISYATLIVVPKVTKWIPLLGTTANIATLLGLLGTIFGLMKSFGAAAIATGAEKQTILSEGIAEALTATSYGLGTALFCLLAHGLLSVKQTALINDIHLHSSRLLDLLYSRQIRIQNSQEG